MKQVAKNAMFLFIRMFLVMAVTLYISRIVLEQLGQSDYGIYSLVAGFVSMLGVLNSAMTTATQRYLAFDIGRGYEIQLNKTFNSALIIHIGIALILLVLAETFGIWYVNNRLIFPEDRMVAVNTVYQFSIFTFLVAVVSVPFNSLIIAREKMQFFAYVSIVEVILNLIIAYALFYSKSDKLIFYSVLLFVIKTLVALIYILFCKKQFAESRFTLVSDKKGYKEMLVYSGWNMFGNIAVVAKGQGINILLNLFFGTVMNAAYGVMNQVMNAINMLASNFQQAINPQIIKTYSQSQLKQTHHLINKGSKITFLLILLIVVPLYINVDYVLELWLKTPPPFTAIFIKIGLINILIDCLSGSLMVGIQATGKMKVYQIVVGTLQVLNFPLSYWLLKLDFSVESVFILSVIISIIALQLRLYFLKLFIHFNVFLYYKQVIARIASLLVIIGMGLFFKQYFSAEIMDFSRFVIESTMALLVVIVLIGIIGLESSERKTIVELIRKRIGK